MFRNLAETLPDGRQILGPALVGRLGSEILAQTGTGEDGPGLGANDGLVPTKLYRYLIQSSTFGTNLILNGNGSGEALGTGSAVIGLYEDNVLVSATTQNRTLSVLPPVVATVPVINTQPASITAILGNNAVFTVAASGEPAPTYQWFVNAAAISGEVSASLTIPSVTLGDTGKSYTVRASNSEGNVLSSAAILTVVTTPSISSQPAAASRNVGQTATFSVTAAGTAPLTYQWYVNGSPVSGATSSTYTTAVLSLLDSGKNVRVRVTNPHGFVDSADAALTVTVAPVPASITLAPSSATVTEGQTANFLVAAAGTEPITFQWKRNGVNISGANSNSYSLVSAQMADTGASFTCQVTNAHGTATSTAAVLTVIPLVIPPAITAQPASASVLEGAQVLFNVSVSGTAPFTYQWYKNTVAISGANSNSYLISAALLSDNGAIFTVRVENSSGVANSNPVTLTVGQPVVPEDYPMDLSQWPPGRVTRFSWGGFLAAPLDVDASEFFAFDFSRRISNSRIVSATVEVYPFFPKGPSSPDYRDGAIRVYDTFVVQRIKSPGRLGKHVVVCKAVLQNGASVALNCTLYILRSGQGYISN